MRARELGTEIGWDRSRLSHHLARMEKRGLIAREECAEDGRGLMVRVTDAGRSAIEKAAPAHVENVRRTFFDLLSNDELDTLTAVLDRLLDNLPRDNLSPSCRGAPDALRTSAGGSGVRPASAGQMVCRRPPGQLYPEPRGFAEWPVQTAGAGTTGPSASSCFPTASPATPAARPKG